MKLTKEQIATLDRFQRYFDLSSRQVAKVAFKRFGVRVTRQAIYSRLNGLTVAAAALQDQKTD